jgi:lipocalin
VCPPEGFSSIPSFDLNAYISKRWYIQQQMEVRYLPKSSNFCVFAEYTRLPKKSFWGYDVSIRNYAEEKDGRVRDTSRTSFALQAKIVNEATGQFAVGLSFLPTLFAGPYWVLDYNEAEGYALISGGPPKLTGEDGLCRCGSGTNDAGLWIFTRQRARNETLVSKVRQIAQAKGFDLSVLNDVDQSNCTEPAPVPSMNLTSADIRQCVVEGGEAISDAMDAAVYIWAATKRCGKSQLEIQCAVDITSAVQSVGSMITVLAKTLNKCGVIRASGCGVASLELTKNMAGLGAAASDLVQKCPTAWHRDITKITAGLGSASISHSPAFCLVNVKNMGKSIAKLTKEFMHVNSNCQKGDKRACSTNVLRLAGGFAAIGEYLAGAIGQCTENSAHDATASCTRASASLVQYAAKVAANGVDLTQMCGMQGSYTSRLYEQNINGANGFNAQGTGTVPVVLMVLLPITAILGFFGGRIFANRRLQSKQTHRLVSGRAALVSEDEADAEY